VRLAEVSSVLRALLRRGRLEREMDLEMQAHVEARAADLEASGLTPSDAHQQARREFGDPVRWKEWGRDARGLRLIDQILFDVRSGLRGVRRSPVLATAAILSIAIGVGANVAVFGLINAVLLRLAPVRDPASLVTLARSNDASGLGSSFSFPFFAEVRDSPPAGITGILARATVGANLIIAGGEPERVTVELVSGSFFDVLGVSPATGRGFIAADDIPGAEPVAVLSDGYWRRRLGGDSQIVGRSVALNGVGFRVIGVAPRTFDGVDLATHPDVRVPLVHHAAVAGMASRLDNRGEYWLQIEGRLAPGAAPAAVAAALTSRFRTLATAPVPATDAQDIQIQLLDGSRGRPSIQRRLAQPLLVLWSLGAVALLLVCLNVANLLVGRTVSRQQELAMRAALGAGPARLAAQLFVESGVIVLAGSGAGLWLARWGANALAAMAAPVTGGVMLLVPFDGRVFAWLAVATITVALICGAWPAWCASAGDVGVVRFDRRPMTGRRMTARRILVAAQISLALTLLVGAGLFSRTLANLHRVDVGADRDRVLMVRLDPRPARLSAPRVAAFYDDLLARVRARPDTVAAAAAAIPIMSGSDWGSGIVLDTNAVDLRPERNAVTPDYFRTIGTAVVQGREFVRADDATGARVAVVNETFARIYFDGQAVGRRVGPAETTGRADFTVVGVVRDGKYAGLREASVPLWFVPMAQVEELGHSDTAERIRSGVATLYVRVAGDPGAAAPALLRDIAAGEPRVLVTAVKTLAAQIDDLVAIERLIARMAVAFSVVAMFLAALGLYAVTSYDVSTRTREFGVRIALGATPAALQRMVLRQTATVVAIGTVVGTVLALLTAQAARGLLFGLQPADPVVLLVGTAMITTVALAAAAIPAHRACRVDPVTALQ